MMITKKKSVSKETIKNIDQSVSSTLFNWSLHEEIYGKNMPYYSPLATKLNKTYKTKNTFQLQHLVFKQNTKITSSYYPLFLKLFQEITNNFIKRDVELLRIKVNLLFQTEKKSRNVFHVDDSFMKDNFFSMIYYINDSDGDTVVYKDKKLIGVKPEAGKVLMFDGKLHHASSSPVKNKLRKVVNINFRYA